jgi:hypothetical protein
VPEVQEEVTRVRAGAMMAEACAAMAEGMAHERVVLLDSILGEVDKAA